MNRERLEVMAAFLDKLPAQLFDFSSLMNIKGKHPLAALADPEHSCGTVGCAMGWMPAMFPDDIDWDRSGLLIFTTDFDRGAGDYLDLSEPDCDWLFFPRRRNEELSKPSRYATAQEVAAHIRRFIAAGGIPGR